MFKSARWRSERNRIKAVFKLQFKAAQVPQTGWEKMMVTLVPIDVGKPSLRSEKTAVNNGLCQWLNPIYETVKFTQDPKTGKINDKVYQFLVSATASTKSGVLGEININLADYAEVYKPTVVSLPLQSSSTGAILHVTVQRVLGDEGREANENGEISKEPVENKDGNAKVQRRTLKSQLSNPEEEESSPVANDANGINFDEVKFQSTRNVPLHADSSSNLRKSSSFDGMSTSSLESGSALNTLQENALEKRSSLLSSLSTSDTQNTDWFLSSDPNGSTSGSNSSDDTLEKQKNDDVDTSARQLSELELQTLRKQVVKERRRGQDLSRELSSLKEERDALKRECEELKAAKKRMFDNEETSPRLQFGAKDSWSMLEEMKQELDHVKRLNVNISLQLQKTQESNTELLFAVRELEELLDQKSLQGNQFPHLRSPDVKKEESSGMIYNSEEEQGEIIIPADLNLKSELELYKKDREELEMQMEQLALEYEILKQENHDISSRLEQTELREQLRMQITECSSHLPIISDLEAQIESLENQLQKHAEEYEANLATVINDKVEQEKRAIQAEEALRKTRWKSADTADKLQEELKRLSAQMSSTFYVNEAAVMKAIAESRELRLENYSLKELLVKSNEELSYLQQQHQVKCQQLIRLIDFKTNEVDELLLELKYTREDLENQKKSEIKQLSKEKSILSEEIEKLTTTTKEMEMLLKERNSERSKFEKELASLKEEANKSMTELDALRSLKDEQDATIKTLNSKVQSLIAQNTDLKHCISDDELEKKNLKKQVFLLRGDLKKEANIIASIEKRLKDNNAKLAVSDGTTKTEILNKSKRSFDSVGSQVVASLLDSKSLDVNNLNGQNADHDISNEFGQLDVAHTEDGNNTSKKFKNDKANGINTNGDHLQQGMEEHNESMNYSQSTSEHIRSNLEANTKAEEEPLVSCNYDQVKIAEVLSKMEAMRERNECMEAELKEMQERYSDMSLKFAQVETERQRLVITVRSLKNAMKN